MCQSFDVSHSHAGGAIAKLEALIVSVSKIGQAARIGVSNMRAFSRASAETPSRVSSSLIGLKNDKRMGWLF
jgi:hypothetical protein